MTTVETVNSRSIVASGRLDAAYFTSPGAKAQELVLMAKAKGLEIELLGQNADVWAPGRFKREWAEPGEDSIAYLRPYDIFEYMPRPAGALSVQRSSNLPDLRVQEGVILQTCSGRNLGPSVMVDAELSTFALSHDLVRIEINDELMRQYVHVLLLTEFGQALLRQGKSGSVVDHLTAAHVQGFPVPMVDADQRNRVSMEMSAATRDFSQARSLLGSTIRALADLYPQGERDGPTKSGWTIGSGALTSKRIDVAYHDPAVGAARDLLLSQGGVALGELAEVWLPPRYKRYYVDPPHGRPILSGRQILQYRPINLRHVSDRSFADPASMEIREGMTLFGGVGRAEGRIGSAGLVGPGRDGWLASNDVMRLVPRPGVSPGAVYGALTTPAVQQQIEALPYGSVVDHLYPEDIESVVVPVIDGHAADSVCSASADADAALAIIDDLVVQVENLILAAAK